MSLPDPGNDPRLRDPSYVNANSSASLTVAASVLLAAHVVFFSLRLASWRCRKDSRWGWDDGLLIPAFIFNVGLCVFGIVVPLTTNLGRHMDVILAEEGPAGIQGVLKSTYALGYIWVPGTALPKLAILSLYLRVFPQQWLRVCTKLTIAFVTCTAISLFIVGTLLCIPVNAWWDVTVKGKCINAIAYFLAGNVPHLFEDVCIMVIPLPALVKLQMDIGKKIGIVATFLIGSMGIVGSSYRLYLFASGKAEESGDISYKSPEPYAWSIVEPGLCFIAACALGSRPVASAIARSPFYARIRSLTSAISLKQMSGKGSGERGNRTPDCSHDQWSSQWQRSQGSNCRGQSTFEVTSSIKDSDTSSSDPRVQKGRSIGVKTVVDVEAAHNHQ